MVILEFLVGFVGSLVVLLTLLAVASPLFVNLLLDEPTEPKKLYTHTMLPPGWAKSVERGGRVIRMLTQTPNKKFARQYDVGAAGNALEEETREHEKIAGPDYWKVKEAAEVLRVYGRASPFHRWNPIGWWCWWLYITTGAVFVGIPLPKMRGQRLRIVKLTSRRRPKVEVETVNEISKRVIRLAEIENDNTDHVRILPFNWYVDVPEVATNEGPRVGIIAVFVLKSINPWKTFYGMERWDEVLTNACVDFITGLVRNLSVNQVVRFVEGTAPPTTTPPTATPPTDGDARKRRTRYHPSLPVTGDVTEVLDEIGLEIADVYALDYVERFTAEEFDAFTAPWRGEQEGARREAVLTREAAGKAAIVALTADAASTKRRTKAGTGVPALTGHFQQATAADGRATVILGASGGQSGALDAPTYQLLQEIRNLLEQRGGDEQ